MPNSLLASALALAQAGIPVFPCIPGTKTPATANGFHAATTDPSQIEAWWTEEPAYNVAVHPGGAGLCVVDTDEAEGEAQWQELQENKPTTFTVRTPRGGLHRYYEGALRDTQHKLGSKIDTRGEKGYTLMPPSRTEAGEYVVVDRSPVADLPKWIPERIASMRKATVRENAPDVRLDTPASISRAIDFLKHHQPVVEGQGSDFKTFIAACWLRDLGISADKAQNLMMQHYRATPKDEWWIEEKITNAYTYGENIQGVDAIQSAASTFAAKLGLEKGEVEKKRSRFWPEDEEEQENGRDPEWLFPKIIPDSQNIVLAGASQTYKTFIALDLALSAATGVPSFAGPPKRTGPVFYAAAEGRSALKKARRRAWKAAHGVSKVPNFYVMPAPMLALDDEVQEFGNQIKERLQGRRPALIVLDTMAKVMAGMDEGKTQDAGRYIQFAQSLQEAFDCPVITIHHEGKETEKGLRGSSAFHAGFDTVLKTTGQKGMKLVTLSVMKHKDAAEPDMPWHLQGREVGGSLVFWPLTPQEHKIMAEREDQFTAAKVVAALKKMGAIGPENEIVTYALAGELVPMEQGQEMEDHLKQVAAAGKALAKLARSTLSAYASIKGRDVSWCIPTAS